jgi:aminomethyltransferase
MGAYFRNLGYFSFQQVEFDGGPLLISRTGYTGELGYECYLPVEHVQALWNRFLEDPRVKPAGLGARDTLRLEMGLPLYGQDLDTAHTPVEAGLAMFAASPAEFIGKAALGTVRQRRVALEIPGRRSARHYDKVLLPSGEVVGEVTSGSFCPSLGYSAALAFVDAAHAGATEFVVQGAKTSLPAKAVDLPFFKHGTARIKLDPAG